jgi:hypothetical protein
LKFQKVKEFSKVPSIFLGQFFHENHLFFEVFEIVIRSNGSLILIFPKKVESSKTRNIQRFGIGISLKIQRIAQY